MDTFLQIMLYAGSVLAGLTLLALVFVWLAKLLQDNTYDPDLEQH